MRGSWAYGKYEKEPVGGQALDGAATLAAASKLLRCSGSFAVFFASVVLPFSTPPAVMLFDQPVYMMLAPWVLLPEVFNALIKVSID